MVEILFFVLGLAVISIAAYFAFQHRHNTQQCIMSITLGVFFATFFMVLPTEWVKAGKEVFCKPLYIGLSSLLYSLKALGGRQDISQLESMALPGILKGLYIVVNYICFTLAPILASSLILSFVGDTGERFRFWLQKAPKCYVFSEINENSLALASGVKSKAGKKVLVFCKGKSADKALVVEAKKLGAIVLYKSCDGLTAVSRFESCEFFLISPDENSNICLAEAVMARHKDTTDTAILINAFVESGTNVQFLESVVKTRENTKIELRCIDEIALFCNHLIYNHPLYDTKGNGKTISVVIVGCGRTGMRMLKTAYWAGQIDGYRLKIRVYDKAAAERQEDFYRQCPGLKKEKTIQFIGVDVDSAAFEEQLLAPENSGDATYIVVAMGKDEPNLAVANQLYQIYRRHFGFRQARMPEILTRVRSQAKSDSFFQNASFLTDRNIHLFGTTAAVFSHKTLFDTELENLAFAVHLAYQSKLGLDTGSKDYADIRKEFQTSEYDRRSSMATALHIPAKLCMCDDIPKTGGNLLTAENLQTYGKRIATDSAFRLRLAINEHVRWNAFMLSEGYMPATVEQMHQYAKTIDSHKDDLSMLHPCIADWDALDGLEHIYNTTYHKSKSFKKYDQMIVDSLPEIWKVAQKMNREHA